LLQVSLITSTWYDRAFFGKTTESDWHPNPTTNPNPNPYLVAV